MELNAKPTETDIVLVHDKILMALIGANNIKPVFTFTTGWELNDPHEVKEPYAAYKQTEKIKKLIKGFEERNIIVNLNDYLSSASELDGYIGEIIYFPKKLKDTENGIDEHEPDDFRTLLSGNDLEYYDLLLEKERGEKLKARHED